MKKITLFTRFLKGWAVAAGGVVPAGATKAVELVTGAGFGWKATEVPIVVTPVLGAITATPAVATVDTAYSGSTSGRTAGSTLSLTGAGAVGLSIDSTTGEITGTPTVAGPVNVVETLAGATGSPKTNAGVITVSA